jgi:predicted nucleotidyltransferase
MIIAKDIEAPETAIADICHRYQVKALSLFGSAARGRCDRPLHFGEDERVI